jgi:hypothetical protein
MSNTKIQSTLKANQTQTMFSLKINQNPNPPDTKKIYPAMLYLPSFLALESLSSYATRIQNIPRDSFV